MGLIETEGSAGPEGAGAGAAAAAAAGTAAAPPLGRGGTFILYVLVERRSVGMKTVNSGAKSCIQMGQGVKLYRALGWSGLT